MVSVWRKKVNRAEAVTLSMEFQGQRVADPTGGASWIGFVSEGHTRVLSAICLTR